MRILWDSGNIGFGGCGINEWDRQVVTQLRKNGHDVTIIVDKFLEKRPKFKSWKAPEGGYTFVNEKITPFNYKSIVKELGGFDLQIGNHFTMFPVCDNILPVVHDVAIKGRWEYTTNIVLSLRGLGTLANTFACTTPYIESQVKDLLPGVKTLSILGGSKFSLGQLNKAKNQNTVKPYIAYWGNRYSKEKNFINLLRTLSYHDLDLKVSGFSSPSEKELHLVKEYGLSERVEFFTALTDEELLTMISNASIYVCPSTYEGMGLPVIEAMSLGIPVVVSPCAALPIVTAGYAYVAESYGHKALGKAINDCLSNPQKTQENVEGALKMTREWTWSKTADRLLSLIG